MEFPANRGAIVIRLNPFPLIIMAALLLSASLLGCSGGDGGPTDCPAGTAGADCTACESGTYCAGGEALPQPCGEDAWDDDDDPATECVAMTECVPGEAVDDQGTATADRVCAACESGTFSAEDNAASCRAWTGCAPTQYIETEGSASADRICDTCPAGTYNTEYNAAA